MIASQGRLRRAGPGDVSRLAALDRACFGNPWAPEVWNAEVARDVAVVTIVEDGPAAPLLAASCLWIVADEAHLLRLATAPAVRGRGFGRDLLTDALSRARGAGCRAMILEVARGNLAAVGLYRRAGFVVVGVRQGYYAAPPDDALVMQRPLSHAP